MYLYSDGLVARLGLILLGSLLLIVTAALRPRAVLSAQNWIALAGVRLAASMLALSSVLPHYLEEGKADMVSYHQLGIAASENLRRLDFSGLTSPFGSDGMNLLTGMLYVPFGADVLGMFFFSAALGIGSVVFFVKAAVLVWPRSNGRVYGAILGATPSLLMWTGVFGKDSWAALGLALWTYAYTLLYARGFKKALGAGAAGFLILLVVRPHIAMICALAALAASSMGGWFRARSGWRKSALFIFMAAALVSGALYPVMVSTGLGSFSVDSVLLREEQVRTGNTIGGSVVDVEPVTSVPQFLGMLPEAVIRIFARPTVLEANNRLSLMAALENLVVSGALLYILCHPKRLFHALRLSQLFVFSGTMIVFLFLFLAPVPNLGLMVRERAQILPFLALFFVAAWRPRQPRGVARRGLAGRTYCPGKLEAFPAPGMAPRLADPRVSTR